MTSGIGQARTHMGIKLLLQAPMDCQKQLRMGQLLTTT
jgi:hypothetical protein